LVKHMFCNMLTGRNGLAGCQQHQQQAQAMPKQDLLDDSAAGASSSSSSSSSNSRAVMLPWHRSAVLLLDVCISLRSCQNH
jgi:hypothetical protein